MWKVNIQGLDKVLIKVDALNQDLCKIVPDLANSGVDVIHEWYNMRGSEWFDNPSLPTHGAGRHSPRPWTEHLSRQWIAEGVTNKDFSVSIESPGLKTHAYGATIRAKGRALTIPVAPEAHRRSTKEFEKATGYKLFRPKKGDNTGKGYLAYVDKGGDVKAAYLFRPSITIKPLHEREGGAGRDALPSHKDLAEAMGGKARNIINKLIANN